MTADPKRASADDNLAPRLYSVVSFANCSPRRQAMERIAANDNKRLLTVTAGNLRQRHLYITGHHDFFPPDCFGPARIRTSK